MADKEADDVALGQPGDDLYFVAHIGENPGTDSDLFRKVPKSVVTRYTYGQLTVAQILALTGVSDGETVWATDPGQRTPYTYYSGDWYSVGGGILT